jgi:hypothetical protein
MFATLLALAAGLVLIGIALFDAFETIVLPRRVSRRLRLAGIFYRATWQPYSSFARKKLTNGARRETFLSFYGPSSLLLLVGLWAIILILGFAALHWAAGSALSGTGNQPDVGTDVYFSGTTFFTLGLGDVTPSSGPARFLTVVECGVGFAFLALLIGYLPIVYQMFARRETNVSLLDQRAGSPPSAAELIRRNVEAGDVSELIRLLHEWEVWTSDLLESHLSYPTLAFFRSQHENQSWVGALALILDVSAYVLACGRTRAVRQAAFTFAIGRHAVGDLANVFDLRPRSSPVDRLDATAAQQLWEVAASIGLLTDPGSAAGSRLAAIRATYEPYLHGLAEFLVMDLPPWVPVPGTADNWESTAWDFSSPVPLFGPDTPFKVR